MQTLDRAAQIERTTRAALIADALARNGRTTRFLPGDEDRDWPRIEIASNGGHVTATLHIHFDRYGHAGRFEFHLDGDAEDCGGKRHMLRDQVPYAERDTVTTSITMAADRVLNGDVSKVANEIDRRLIAPSWLLVEKVHTFAAAESDRLLVQHATLKEIALLVGAIIHPPSEHGDKRAALLADHCYGKAPYYEVGVSTYHHGGGALRSTVTINSAQFDIDTFREIAALVQRRRAAGLIAND